jgi:regulatory protein
MATPMNVALNFLAQREYSVFELKNKLLEKGFEEGETAEALIVLMDKDLLSDQRFGEALTRYRIGKGYGPLYIRPTLRKKGLSNEMISAILKDHEEAFEKGLQVALKNKFPLPLVQAEDQLKSRRFLALRGFSEEMIRRAIKQTETE